MIKGKVYRSTGSWYDVKTEEGLHVQARLRGKFKLDELKLTNPIAVGDEVIMEKEERGDNTYVVMEILDRKNYLVRKSSRKTGHNHIVASNLDLAIVVVSLKYPRTSYGFIDRFLVTAEAYDIQPLILLNKTDLLKEENIKDFISLYESIGYEVLPCSAKEGTGIQELHDRLKDNCTLIAGHSGVGKSSIVNALFPQLDLRTTQISKHTNKGQHTTTYAELHEPEPGIQLIDTPGIKEFGLVNIEKQELGHFFPEIQKIVGDCKFYNCLHVNEPGCALKDAQIPESRYKSYLSILEDCD